MKKRLFALICLCLLLSPAWALMRVQTPVPMSFGQQQAEQELPRAWQQLMVRLLGQQNPSLPPPDDLSSFVLSNGFEFSERSLMDPLNLPIPTQLWVVQFDQAKVLAHLQQLNQSYWPLIRPDTLLWVDVDGGLMSDSERSLLSYALRDLAAQRGIRLALPLWDLEEQLELAAFGAQSDSRLLARASERYDTEWAFQVVPLNSAGQEVVLQWRSLLPAVDLQWQSRGDDLQQALLLGLHRLADEQARRLMQVTFTQQQRLIWDLVAVEGYAAFFDLTSYLSDHPSIESLVIMEVEADRVRVELSPRISEHQLRNQLQIARRILPVESGALVPSYRWVR